MAWGPLYAKYFPHCTCPYSRHTKVIADDILRSVDSPVRKMLIDATYEPDHWALALEHTVKMLWEARARIKELEEEIEG